MTEKNKQGKRNFLSIEIGSNDLKVAHIKIDGGKPEILGVKTADIAKLPEDNVAQKISELTSGFKGIKKAEIVNVVPSNYFIFKNIEIPSVDKKEINDIIDLQAGRHTPYSREEIILGYMNLGTVHERYTKVLLVIVKKDIVSKRYDMIKKAGFQVSRTVLSAESMAKCFFTSHAPENANPRPVAIVNVDNVHTDFIVGHAGKSLYIRSIPVGNKNFALESEAARDKFLDELKKSIESYQSENVGSLPQSIFFTGMMDAAGDLKEKMLTFTSIVSNVVTEAWFIGLGSQDSTITREKPGAAVLSIITPPCVYGELELDLIPEDVKIRKAVKDHTRLMTKVAAFSLISIFLFCTGLLTNMIFKNLYLEKLSTSYTSHLSEADKLKMTSTKTGTVELFLNKKGEVLRILTELFNALPPEVYLNSLGYRDDRTLSFAGTTDNMSRVFSLVTDLENNKYFSNVKVDSTRTRRVDDKEVADFGLTITVEDGI